MTPSEQLFEDIEALVDGAVVREDITIQQGADISQALWCSLLESESRPQSQGVPMVEVESRLIQLMQELCEELGLPEEKDEHAPILEALNVAHNIGAQRCASGFARAGLLKEQGVPTGEEYASPEVWRQFRGLYEIAKAAWVCRTSENKEAHAQLDDALDFFADVVSPAHLDRIAKPVPYPELPAAYERGRSQAAGDGWVSTTERLPPGGRVVIVFDAATSGQLMAWKDHGAAVWYPQNGLARPMAIEVTHWRPLPAPPSDSGKGGET